MVEYVDPNERCPFGDWFDRLDAPAAVRVRRAIARMEAGNLGDSKSVGKGVVERRLDFGPGYRLYYGREGDEVVILLVGGTKKGQQKDIETAHQLWAEYNARKTGH